MKRPLSTYTLAALPLLVAALALIFFAAANRPAGDWLLPAYPGDGGNPLKVGLWLKAHPIPEGKALFPVELTRTARSSTSIVQVAGGEREPYHVHARHDLFVTVLRGKGMLKLGNRELPMWPGRSAQIPAGTPHAFINTRKHPAAALVTFSPAYDPKDMKKVEE